MLEMEKYLNEQHSLNHTEVELFGAWAFGEEYHLIDTAMKFLDCWNYHHGDVLKLDESGFIGDYVPRMINLWRKSLEKSSE